MVKKNRNAGKTVTVSNLDAEVTENDVKEIFQKIGKVVKASLNFDANGRSRGTGEVIFANKNQAQKAVDEYDRAEVDGRPMYLKLVGGAEPAAPVRRQIVVKPVGGRKVQPRPKGRPVKRAKGVVKANRGRRGFSKGRRTLNFSRRTTGRRGSDNNNRKRGRGRGRGRGSRRRSSSKPKTAAQLDKELEQYHNSGGSSSNKTQAQLDQMERLDNEMDQYHKKGRGNAKTQADLDREMDLYHLRAGQPAPVEMDETV